MYSTPHTAATFAASNAGSSHHAALLGDASHVPHTNSTALVSVDCSPVGGGTTLRNVFAGSLTPLRTTHISSGDVGDLLRHTASPAPSLAISAALVTGTAAPAPLVPTPGNDPTPDDWDPDDWDPAQHVTSFRPGLRTWLPMGCPLSNRTSHRPVGSAYVSPAATAASSCSSEHDGLAIMNANSSPGASASVTCSKMERCPGSAGVMSARWVHAGLNPSSPSLRFPDRIPHGAPPGQPTSHTLHTGHGAWFCRMIGGMPHTLTRNASVSVFVCVPVSEASISAEGPVASACTAVWSAPAASPRSAPTAATASASSSFDSPFTACVSADTSSWTFPLHSPALRGAAAPMLVSASPIEATESPRSPAEGMRDWTHRGVAAGSLASRANVPAPSHGVSTAPPPRPASQAVASTPAPSPSRSAAGANPHVPPSLAPWNPSPRVIKRAPTLPPRAPTIAATPRSAATAPAAFHRPSREDAAPSSRPETEATRLSGSTTDASSAAAILRESAARSGTRSAALIVSFASRYDPTAKRSRGA